MHIVLTYYMCIFFLKAKQREFSHLVRVTGSKLVNIRRLHYIHMIYQLTFTIKKLAYICRESFTLPIHSLCQLHTAPIPIGVRGLTAFRSTPHCFYTYCTWVVQRWTAYVPTCSY